MLFLAIDTFVDSVYTDSSFDLSETQKAFMLSCVVIASAKLTGFLILTSGLMMTKLLTSFALICELAD